MKQKTTIDSILLKELKKNKVMKLSELYPWVGNRTAVLRKARQGVIQVLGGGYYACPTLDPFVASLAVLSKYYPTAVISHRTALRIHGLSQDMIAKIDIDILRGKSIRNRLLQVHRVPESRISGVVEIKYYGVLIKIYDIERSLAEAYRIDPDGAYFFKALKRYIAIGNIRADLIKKYDTIAKTKVLNRLKQELADD